MRGLSLLAVLFLAGCGQQAADRVDEAGLNRQTAGPASESARASIVPPFPGSTPVEVPNLGAPGTDSRSGNAIAMETSADPEQVAAYYREHFQRTGIMVRADTANAQGGLISVARDGEPGAMITISRIGNRTRIAVISRAH
jgi:hypothetical protein